MDDPVARLKAGLDEDEAWFRDRCSVDDPVGEDLRQRLLRAIAAHRKILAAHSPDPAGKFGSIERPRCLVCLTDRGGYEEQWEADDWPCLTVLTLAAVYGDDDT